MHHAAQKRLLADGLLGLLADAFPDRIEFGQFHAGFNHVVSPLASGPLYQSRREGKMATGTTAEARAEAAEAQLGQSVGT
ncbi:MAG: hypothetical protein Kow0058_02180 [Roseovarius sp.]